MLNTRVRIHSYLYRSLLLLFHFAVRRAAEFSSFPLRATRRKYQTGIWCRWYSKLFIIPDLVLVVITINSNSQYSKNPVKFQFRLRGRHRIDNEIVRTRKAVLSSKLSYLFGTFVNTNIGLVRFRNRCYTCIYKYNMPYFTLIIDNDWNFACGGGGKPETKHVYGHVFYSNCGRHLPNVS